MSAAHGHTDAHGHDVAGIDAQVLPPEQGKRLVTIGAGLAIIGLVLCGIAAAVDRHRFTQSYLTGLVWMTTIGLGALWFVVLQHLAKAGWSVAARRQMEWISQVLPVCAILFIPIFLFGNDVYHHWMHPHGEHAELIKKKAAWLNPGFFYGRTVFYFVLWSAMALWFHRTSRAQDVSGDHKLTLRMQMVSAPSMLLFAITITFAGFDWLMSIDPTWYSTIFGIYVFAGSVTSSLATLALITVALQRAGLFRRVSTVEHRHDIGKLLFAFTVFWAYIAFSQFLLIWYGNLPEETLFFARRWNGSWKVVSLLILFGHFFLPFMVLIARTTKRSPTVLALIAGWMLFIHYVDMYWLVMPNFYEAGVAISWIDLAGLLGPLGVLAFVLAWKASKGPLYPLKDPRLAETMKNVNL